MAFQNGTQLPYPEISTLNMDQRIFRHG
uniref:Uncharacterized protein n=1 Tax=Arundo donax TaxID=35708 RepID=A0A0A9ELY7_ARUDO